MQFSGTETFPDPQAIVWGRLSDMHFISGLIPDQQRVEEVRPDGFSCRVRPSLSFFAGALRLTFDVTHSQPPDTLEVQVHGKGMGASVTVGISIAVSPSGSGTNVSWTATVAKRTGLLKPVGESLIQGAAEQVIASFWRAFRAAPPPAPKHP